MRRYNSSQKYRSSFGLIDLLFNLLVGFVFLFVIAFILINPISKNKIIDAKAEFLIVMSWPDNDTNDIDIWVRRDEDDIISFRKKDSGIMHLDRDDLGNSNDTIFVDGKEMKNPANREVVSIRQKIPGHYTVNIHWYSKKGDKPLDEVPVELELIRVNPYRMLGKVTKTMVLKGSEITAYQFDITESGAIININDDQEAWVMKHVSEHQASLSAFNDGREGGEFGSSLRRFGGP